MSAAMSPAQTADSPSSRHPFIDLLRRYRDVWTASWARRHELTGPARLADEVAFLPAALSLQATPPHPSPRRAIWVIVGLFTVALLWACLGYVDIVAVAPGRIVVSDGTKLVQPLEAGVVRAIHVRDGDTVRAGQLLIELDPTMARADNSRVDQERSAALSDLLRTRALLGSLSGRHAPVLPTQVLEGEAVLAASERLLAQSQLDAEWADIQAQRAKLEADISARRAELDTVGEQVAKLVATLPMARQREADFQTLAKQGFVSQHAGQDRERVRVEMERDLATYRARYDENRAAIVQAEQTRKAWMAETLKALSERHAKADLLRRQLQEEGTKASQRERLASLVSPVDGTVQQLAVHTTGGVVSPAQVLLVVVPQQAEVTAEVMLQNKDVGFVDAGQDAEIKLETFPYTRYGTVSAKVTHITADAVMQQAGITHLDPSLPDKGSAGAVFPAALTLFRREIPVDGKAVKIAPGMNITAEIKTGKRRIIDYLLSPVRQHAGESLRER